MPPRPSRPALLDGVPTGFRAPVWAAAALTSRPQLRRLLQVVEQVGMVAAPDGFSCDGGALLVAHVADRLELDRTLHVGRYLWPSPSVRAAVDGLGGGADEHHHWVEIDDGAGLRWLIDPNGTCRLEPHLRLAPADQYQPDPQLRDLCPYDPDGHLPTEATYHPEVVEWVELADRLLHASR